MQAISNQNQRLVFWNKEGGYDLGVIMREAWRKVRWLAENSRRYFNAMCMKDIMRECMAAVWADARMEHAVKCTPNTPEHHAEVYAFCAKVNSFNIGGVR